MAALTPVTADFRLGDTSAVTTGTAGVAITAGQLVYLDSATAKYKLAINTSAAAAAVVGVAATTAATDKKIAIVTSGTIESANAYWTAGQTYVLDQVAGQMQNAADVITADLVSVIGVASTTQIFKLSIDNTGFIVP